MSGKQKPMPTPVRVGLEDTGYMTLGATSNDAKIKRLITRDKHGAELMLGVSVMAAGQETSGWSSRETDDTVEGEHWYGPIEETYFCIKGRFKLIWDEGEIDFGPTDAVYLAPGWRYRLINVGDEEGFFVYNMHPAQE